MTRAMTDDTYDARADHHFRKGRRQACRWMVCAVVIAGLAGFGLGSARAADIAGGGRTDSPAAHVEHTHVKWVLLWAAARTDGGVPGMTAMCVGNRCAVWSPDHGLEIHLTVGRDGRYYAIRALIPDVSTVS